MTECNIIPVEVICVAVRNNKQLQVYSAVSLCLGLAALSLTIEQIRNFLLSLGTFMAGHELTAETWLMRFDNMSIILFGVAFLLAGYQTVKKQSNLSIFFICIIFLVWRIRFGANMYDEAWYVAEPVLAAQGARPFTSIWTQAPGVCFPLFIPFSIYTARFGTDGIFIFAKFLFIIWLVSALAIVKLTNKDIPIVALLPILFFSPHALFYIDYNTIGPVYLFLASLLIFRGHEKRNWMCFFAGILVARAVIGTPYVVLPAVMIGLMFICAREFKLLLYYIFGAVVFTVITIFYCSSGGGIAGLFNGIKEILFSQGYTEGLGAQRKLLIKDSVIQTVALLTPAMIACVYGVACKYVFYDNHKETYKKCIILYEYVSVAAGIIAGIILSPEVVMRHDLSTFIKLTWYISFFHIIFLNDIHNNRREFYIKYSILAIGQYVLTVFNNVTGSLEREYILYFSSVISIWVICETAFLKKGNERARIHLKTVSEKRLVLNSFICVMTCLSLMNISGSYVFWKTEIDECDVKIEQGIYRGCYTDKGTADYLKWIEPIIKENTHNEETVAFFDKVPYAYLMAESKIFAPTTLGNIGNTGLDYFQIKGEIPDKIIYINSFPSSTEDNKFTKFVLSNYDLKRKYEAPGKIDGSVVVFSKK